jgi:hypothetical protein
LEFCDKDDEIGSTAEEQHRSLRFTHSMDTALGKEEVFNHLEETREPVLMVSLPCTPWAKFIL